MQNAPARPTHQESYIPLYVTPIVLPDCPAPPTSRTALYALAIAPSRSLETGTLVHLHYLYAAIQAHSSPTPHNTSVIIPLDIRGRIAGERARTPDEIEYVVKNDESGAFIQRAFVRFRFHPGALPPPNLGHLVAQHLPARLHEPELPSRGCELPSRGWRSKNHRERGPEDRPEPLSLPTSKTAPADAPPENIEDLTKTLRTLIPSLDPQAMVPMDLRFVKDPSTRRLDPLQPYKIWDVYGSHVQVGSSRAETEALRNYGCPIVIRSRAEIKDFHIPFESRVELAE